MCSTSVQRIAEFGQAIDDLAADARTAYGARRRGALPGGSDQASPREAAAPATAPRAPAPRAPAPAAPGAGSTGAGPGREAASEADEADRVVIRLAELWGQLASLDPEVARRLAGYEV
ncbi:MAG TPA: hypothetical protein VEM58_13785 [Streptosporangiaceae bacterium]|nr:hypothetical protein [Streptosporangiaceae bacterium]